MSIIGQRMSEVITEKGISLRKLEELTGIGRGTLSKYISQKSTPKAVNIHKIAQALDVDEQWVMGLSDVRRISKNQVIGDWVTIPVYSELSCGKGSLTEEIPIDYIALPPSMMFSGKAFGNVAQGDSMEPAIHDGDLLIFQEIPEVVSGQIGSFSLNGKFYCKRFRKYADGTCWLLSDNPEYAPIPIRPEDDFRTLGLYKMKLSEEQ